MNIKIKYKDLDDKSKFIIEKSMIKKWI